MLQKKPILEVRKAKFAYRKNTPVLRNISFEAFPGEIIGVLGENGSGKSTLLKLLVGMLTPQEGTLRYWGSVGYCPQDLLLFEFLTVAEHFQLYGAGYRLVKDDISQKQQYLLEKLRFAQYEHEQVRDLSGGTKQKLNLSLALLHDPDILLLDEPYQGFDYDTFLRFWELQDDFRAKSKTILIVSHLIEDRSKLDRTVTLRDGYSTPCDPGCHCRTCLREHENAKSTKASLGTSEVPVMSTREP
jgi:ABC-type multidrug transport system ATPase subunit